MYYYNVNTYVNLILYVRMHMSMMYVGISKTLFYIYYQIITI